LVATNSTPEIPAGWPRSSTTDFIDKSYKQLACGFGGNSMSDGKSKLLQAVRAVRNEIYAAVREQLADDGKTYQQIADSVGCSLATVQRIAQRDGVTRTVGPRPRTASEPHEGNSQTHAAELMEEEFLHER
jgi:hypothetical protein